MQNNGSRVFYVDGLVDNADIPTKPEGVWKVNYTAIGGIFRGVPAQWVTGVVDDVAIWKRALSSEELMQLPMAPVGDLIIENAPDPQSPIHIDNFYNFKADYTSVAKHQKVSLRWDAQPDTILRLNQEIGDVTNLSKFGSGSIEVSVDASTTFTLTETYRGQLKEAHVRVNVYDDIAVDWNLIENFENMDIDSISGQERWKNPQGRAFVVQTETELGKALTLESSALAAILLKSQTIHQKREITNLSIRVSRALN